MIRTLLQQQIAEKEQNRKNELKAKHDFENMQNADNERNLEMMKTRRAEMKEKAKNHWRAELERVKASHEIPVPVDGEE